MPTNLIMHVCIYMNNTTLIRYTIAKGNQTLNTLTWAVIWVSNAYVFVEHYRFCMLIKKKVKITWYKLLFSTYSAVHTVQSLAMYKYHIWKSVGWIHVRLYHFYISLFVFIYSVALSVGVGQSWSIRTAVQKKNIARDNWMSPFWYHVHPFRGMFGPHLYLYYVELCADQRDVLNTVLQGG